MVRQPLDDSPKPDGSHKLNPYSQRELDTITALLDSWCDVSEEEAHEQKETWEYLKKVLDEDRPADRKLFS